MGCRGGGAPFQGVRLGPSFQIKKYEGEADEHGRIWGKNLTNLTGTGSKCQWPPGVDDGEPLAAAVQDSRYGDGLFYERSGSEPSGENTEGKP